MMEFFSREVADDGQESVIPRKYDSQLSLLLVFLGYFL